MNGETQELQGSTLAELCASLGYEGAKVATALNGTFVPAAQRKEIRLSDNDRVEIVSPRQGG